MKKSILIKKTVYNKGGTEVMRFVVWAILNAVLSAVCGFSDFKCGFKCGLRFHRTTCGLRFWQFMCGSDIRFWPFKIRFAVFTASTQNESTRIEFK